MTHTEIQAKKEVANATPRRRVKKGLVFFCSVVILVGLLLRFVGMELKPGWIDEGHGLIPFSPVSKRIATKIDSKAIYSDALRISVKDTPVISFWHITRNIRDFSIDSAPLYSLLAAPFVAQFGNTINTLRLFSAFLSITITPLFFWFVLELTRRRDFALIGATIISVSPFLTLYSIEGLFSESP